MLVPTPPQLPRQSKHPEKVFVTSDEHYFHKKILIYQENRNVFQSVEAMNEAFWGKHNEVVTPKDHTIHVGDFCLGNLDEFLTCLKNLNGHHYLMDGSHDRPLEKYVKSKEIPTEIARRVTILPKLFEFEFDKIKLSLCHYMMAKWWSSHYQNTSAHFFGHSHGHGTPIGQALDIGVDTNNYTPYKLTDAIMQAHSKACTENHPGRGIHRKNAPREPYSPDKKSQD